MNGHMVKALLKRAWRCAIVLGLVLALTAGGGATYADTIYVDDDAEYGGGRDDGTSWDDAYASLSDALNAAESGDEIRVAGGGYRPESDLSGNAYPMDSRTKTFVLKNGVKLYGGYAGQDSSNPDERSTFENSSVLEGMLDSGECCYHVLSFENGSEAVLDGFLVRNGQADGSDWLEDRGGGLCVEGAELKVNDCTFQSNGGSEGAGIYIGGNSHLILSDCFLSDNNATEGGGALCSLGDASYVEISGCTFVVNSGSEGAGIYFEGNSQLFLNGCSIKSNTATEGGGGLCSRGDLTDIVGCSFSGNSAVHGGGIFHEGNALKVRASEFEGNSANGSYGGGIFLKEVPGTSSTVEDCCFKSNSACTGGGGIYNAASDLFLKSCAFAGNTVPGNKEGDGHGGALFDDGHSATINNCTFSGNSVYITGDLPGYGGGVYERGTASRLTNCTFRDNTAQYGGQGAGLYSDASEPQLTNCIFWDGDDLFDIGYANLADRPAVNHCIVYGGYNGEAIGDDPKLLDLDNYDSATVYGTSGNWHYLQTCALLTGSPALDAGAKSVMSGDAQLVPLADARGVKRPQGDGVDIGAYEAKWYTITVSSDAGCAVSAEPYCILAESTDFTAYDMPEFIITPEVSMDLAGIRLDGVSLDLDEFGDSTGAAYGFAPLSADHMLEATFAVKTFDITEEVSGDHGTITPSVSSVKWGEESCFVMTADEHYHIASLVVDGSEVAEAAGASRYGYTFTGVRADHSISVTFAINEYSVTFTAGEHGNLGGELSQTVSHGSDCSTVTAQPGTGYHFVNWTDDRGAVLGTDANLILTKVTENRNVVANFAIDVFTITTSTGENGGIDPNGPVSAERGTDRSFTVTADEHYHIASLVVDGSEVAEAAGASRYGYTFTGVGADHSISATFAINEYSVTFTAGEHGSLGGELSQTISHGSACSAVTAMPEEGYYFVNWTDDRGAVLGTDANIILTNVTENRNVVANFAIDVFTITASAGENGGIDPNGPVSAEWGDDGYFTVTADEHYHIASLVVDGSEVAGAEGASRYGYTFTGIGADHSISATFAINEYSVTFTAGEHGNLGGELSQTVSHGSDCSTVTAQSGEGYHFVNWTGDVAGLTEEQRKASSLILTKVTENRNVVANFAIDVFTITASAGENGGIDPNDPVSAEWGDDGYFTVTADEHYHIASLVVDGSEVAEAAGASRYGYTFTGIGADHSISATFAINEYSVTFTAGEHGSLGGELSQTVSHGSDCSTVTAQSGEGYHFVNWTGDVAGLTEEQRKASSLILTNVTENRSVVANFAINEYSVTFTAGEHGSLGGELSQTISHGSACSTVTAQPEEGYSLVNWTDGDGAVLGIEVKLILTDVTKDLSITAHFSSIPSVSSITPVAGAIGVRLHAEICVIFDRNIMAGPNIGDLSIGGAKQKISEIEGRVDGAVLRVPHAALTERNSVYTVIIPSGAVRSSDGVENAEIRWNFTTVSDETTFASFSFPEQHDSAVIDDKAHIIRISVNGSETSPRNSAASLAPAIEVSRGATVSPASGEPRNFTSPVVYTVTAEDGVTKTDWTAVVTVLDGTSTIESDAFDVVSPEGEMYGRIGAKEGGTPLDFRLSVEKFLAGIESGAEGQTLEVIDEHGEIKDGSERIRPGDLLRVTAADGSTSIYVIDAKYLIYLEVGEGGCVSVAYEYGEGLRPDGDGYLAVEPDCVITFTVRPDEKWRIDELLYNAKSVEEADIIVNEEGDQFTPVAVNCNGAFSAEFAWEQDIYPAVPVLAFPEAASTDCDLTPLLGTEAYDASGAEEHGETRWEIASDKDFTQVVFDVRTHRYLTEIRMGRDVLSPGRTYHWRARFFDEDDTPSAWSDSRSFTTVEAKKAGIDNGVPVEQALSDDEEIELPGDWNVSNVSEDCKIFRGATEGEQVGIRAQAGSGAIEQAESLPKEVLSDDMGTGDLLKLPRGLVSFRIRLDASDIAGSASVRVHFSSPLPPELRHWYKYSEGDGWTDYSDRAVFAADGSWVDLELRDGGEGDADGLANAVIVDPGGPGKLAIGGDDPSGSGCGHGCDVFGSMPDAVLLLVPFAFLLGRKRR